MTLFQLVRATLNPLYASAVAAHGNNTDAAIAAAVKYLSASYDDLTDTSRAKVNYQDPVTRFAYVYKYVAAHASYVEQLLGTYRLIKGQNVFADERLRLTCIGGGPGSDLIAVLKFISEHTDEPVKKVTSYLVDGEQGWADSWTELDDTLNLPFNLNTNFQPLDVTQPNTWATQTNFLNADVFTISYFVSEVMSLDHSGVVTSFWNNVFSSAKSGALFFYTDNGADCFNSYFDNLWNAHGLVCVYKYDNVRTLPSYDEEKADLGDYLTKFGHMPKIQSYLSGRILIKQ